MIKGVLKEFSSLRVRKGLVLPWRPLLSTNVGMSKRSMIDVELNLQ